MTPDCLEAGGLVRHVNCNGSLSRTFCLRSTRYWAIDIKAIVKNMTNAIYNSKVMRFLICINRKFINVEGRLLCYRHVVEI